MSVCVCMYVCVCVCVYVCLFVCVCVFASFLQGSCHQWMVYVSLDYTLALVYHQLQAAQLQDLANCFTDNKTVSPLEASFSRTHLNNKPSYMLYSARTQPCSVCVCVCRCLFVCVYVWPLLSFLSSLACTAHVNEEIGRAHV